MKSEISELSLMLEDCSYDSKDRQTLINMIRPLLDYPKKIEKVKFSIKELYLNKIIMAWYPIIAPLNNKY